MRSLWRRNFIFALWRVLYTDVNESEETTSHVWYWSLKETLHTSASPCYIHFWFNFFCFVSDLKKIIFIWFCRKQAPENYESMKNKQTLFLISNLFHITLNTEALKWFILFEMKSHTRFFFMKMDVYLSMHITNWRSKLLRKLISVMQSLFFILFIFLEWSFYILIILLNIWYI